MNTMANDNNEVPDDFHEVLQNRIDTGLPPQFVGRQFGLWSLEWIYSTVDLDHLRRAQGLLKSHVNPGVCPPLLSYVDSLKMYGPSAPVGDVWFWLGEKVKMLLGVNRNWLFMQLDRLLVTVLYDSGAVLDKVFPLPDENLLHGIDRFFLNIPGEDMICSVTFSV